MPFAVPSHMGLAAPLWRRWPHLFDAPAMCVGAVMPDVVDGIVGVARGHLGQGIGHSLIGLFFLCVPGGVAIWYAVIAYARRARPMTSNRFLARCWNAALDATLAAPATRDFRKHVLTILLSLLVGAITHLVFDVLSHGECPWLYPWINRLPVFPAWWEHVWFRMPIPGYKNGYPFAPHFLSWLFISFLGAYLLLAPVYRTHRTS